MSSVQTLLATLSNASNTAFDGTAIKETNSFSEEQRNFDRVLEQTVQQRKEAQSASADHPNVKEAQHEAKETEKTKKSENSSDDQSNTQQTSQAAVPEDWTVALLRTQQSSAGNANTATLQSKDDKNAGSSNSFYSNNGIFSAQSSWQGNSNSLAGSNPFLSLSGGTTGTSMLGTKETQLFAAMMNSLKSDGQSDMLTKTKDDSSPVTLSGDFNALSSSVMLNQAEQSVDGKTAASAMKSVQSILGEYWVPPVQVNAQSSTEATIQMNLKDGGTLTMHLQLGDAQNANLRIEAPAATLAAMQSKLAPLQEALMQQGLTLAPVQWGVAKSAVKAVAAVSDEKNSLLHDHTASRETSDSLLNASDDRYIKPVTSVEDSLG